MLSAETNDRGAIVVLCTPRVHVSSTLHTEWINGYRKMVRLGRDISPRLMSFVGEALKIVDGR